MTFNRQAMSQWMEQHRVIEHLQQAIRCNTVNPPGNERPLAENIRLLLASYGIEADLFAVSEAPGRANLIAVIRGERPGKTLVFSGHTDTVPVGENDWRFDPFAAELIDGKLYGRGAADMKGGLYALLYAFIKCKLDGAVAAGELIFAASFGEETGSEGARRMVDERLLTAFDAMVIAEPTDNRLFIAHKGVLWLKVESIGKTAHSSMPDHGINAIMALHQFVERLNGLNLSAAAHPLLTPATLAVTTFKGGLKTNMVPDYGMLTIDLRTLPEHSHNDIYDSVAAIADEVTRSGKGAILKVSRLLDLPGLTTPADAVIVETIRTVVHDGLGRDVEGAGVNYFTDGSVFQELGDGDIVVLGPGKPELAHQPDEYVSISELEESIYIYAQTAAKYLR